MILKFLIIKMNGKITTVNGSSANIKKGIMNRIDINSFYFSTYDFYVLLNQKIDYFVVENDLDISFSQYQILSYIYQTSNKKMNQKELESLSFLKKPSISQQIKKLKEKGYVLHRSLKGNARCKEVILTKKALMILEKTDQQMKVWEELLDKQFSNEDRQSYFQLLNKVHSIILENKESEEEEICLKNY